MNGGSRTAAGLVVECGMNNAAIDALAARLAAECTAYAGYLTTNEASFLAIMAACTPGDGVILEIGSFMGKSTIILCQAEEAATGRSTVVAVDPLILDVAANEIHEKALEAKEDLYSNLDRAGVRHLVEFHEMTSQKLAPTWDRPIRVLWIDGDHSFEGATSDFELFWQHVVPGGVIAFHDVMHCAPVTKVFADRVLRSDVFDRAGVVGSIGWARRRPEGEPDRFGADRQRLADGLDRHRKAKEKGTNPVGKRIAKLQRWRVPHGAMTAEAYKALIGADRVSAGV